MPTQIKLTTAGESVTMQVKSCEKNTVGQYPGMLWTGKDMRGNLVTIEMPMSSSERQLKRLELTPQSIVGRVVTISRDPNSQNPSKPWWGVNIVGEGTLTPVEAPPLDDGPHEETGAPPKEVAKAPPATPAVGTGTLTALGAEQIVGKYLVLLDRVAEHVRQRNNQDFYDYATAQPICATIWITLTNKGLIS